MSLSFFLRHNFPLSFTFYDLLKKVPNCIRKRKPDKTEDNYHDICVQLSETKKPLADHAFNFFLRVFLEYKFKLVIEIGSFKGSTILNLKRMIPELDAYGVDIGKTYESPWEKDNVKFQKFEKNLFTENPTKGCVISRVTFAYFSATELKEFLKLLKKNGWACALSEPVPPYGIKKTTVRGVNSLYHPYERYAKEIGFNIVREQGHGVRRSGNFGMMENNVHLLLLP